MTSLDDLPIRNDLRGKKPYGAPQLRVPVELNVNENTHGIPQEVADEIVTSITEVIFGLNRYPDRDFSELRQALAVYLGHGITNEQIWAGNGSNEVLQQVLQAFGGPGRKLLSFTPTYSMYPLLADGTQTEWVGVPRQEDFSISQELVTEAIRTHSPDITFFCKPNNPTGTGLDLEVIRRAYDATEGIVLVDEAYQEFSEEESALSLLSGRPRLLVSRTMSKAFAFAGVRLGYLAADPSVIDALKLVRLPYHLSSLTQAAATAALRHSSRMLTNVNQIKTQRDRLVRELADMGYQPYPSEANFVLFGGVSEPKNVFLTLLEQGILIREMGIPHTLRVTAGTEAETTQFLAAMSRINR